ncbi:MAG TPA: hypothetical protein VGM23_16115, partial [Armatimonadota bacterium]
DVDTHFTFARDNDLTLQPNGGGALLRNLLPKIHEYDRPYHVAQWLGWSSLLPLMSPEDIVQPGKDFNSLTIYYGGISYGGKKLYDYRNWMFQQTVKELVKDDNLVDWLDPNGEVGPMSYEIYWDFSETNRKHFADWLRTSRGYTLASVGEAMYGNTRKFSSWEQVPIPLDYDLFGWQKDSIRTNASWRRHSGDTAAGLAQGYQQPDFNDTGWMDVQMPGSEAVSVIAESGKPFWFRGTLDVPADWLNKKRAAGRIYLQSVTLTPSGNIDTAQRYWINGQEIGGVQCQPGMPVCASIEVTQLLRPGTNTIAYATLPGGWPPLGGVFFLATKPMEQYPFTDTHLNARWYEWREYISACIAERMENTLKAIRGVDPNRSIKMHAAVDKDLSMRLEEKYGGYGHNTGDEAYFRPWDRRFGYVRGLPGSAESSGSVEDPAWFKRWLGYRMFTGLNGLDYFHDIQSMMYSPCADLWQQYLPYFKLTNRFDIKKPNIALFWSAMNNRLLPRCLPYCWDLGRGDLQPLGYSYVYVDETTFQDGLVQDYPVVWDTGTQIMTPQTVQRIRAYVEAGGTFVALQDTGRDTPFVKNAWPISALTGFKVREIRRMEGDTVGILHDQPVFSALAGKTFYNRGWGIDYSNYNYADKCLVLDATVPEAQTVACYGDGTTAIGTRKLGKGRVIVLGSPFWRDSYDKQGLWWPGEGQSTFLEDIFHTLGLQPLATANTHKVWREHYQANNGMEEYLVLNNPYDEPQTFSTTWTTVHPCTALYDPKNQQPIAGVIEGNTVKLEKLTLAPRETLVVAAAVKGAPVEAVNYWFKHLAWWWRPSAGGEMLERPALPYYELALSDEGRVQARQTTLTEVKSLDLAAWSSGTLPKEGWSKQVGFSPEVGKKLPADQAFVFTVTFETPAAWKQGDTCQLLLQTASGSNKVDAWLNGKQILQGGETYAGGPYNMVGGLLQDIGATLNYHGKNTLVFTTGKQGFMGAVKVQWRPTPVETLDVQGSWDVQVNEDDGTKPAALPGKFTGLYATKRDIVVPASWKNSRVFIQVDLADIRQYAGMIVNKKALLLPFSYGHRVNYMDITPWVKFGQPNTLVLYPSDFRSVKPSPLEVKRVTLQRVQF